jgi:hypothetical protein
VEHLEGYYHPPLLSLLLKKGISGLCGGPSRIELADDHLERSCMLYTVSSSPIATYRDVVLAAEAGDHPELAVHAARQPARTSSHPESYLGMHGGKS